MSAAFVKIGSMSRTDLRCHKGFAHKVSPNARTVEEVVKQGGVGVKRSFATLQTDEEHRQLQLTVARSRQLQQGIEIRQMLHDWHKLPGTRALLKLIAKDANKRFRAAKLNHQCESESLIREIRKQQSNLRDFVDEQQSQERLNILQAAVSSFLFPGTTTKINGEEYLKLLDDYQHVNLQVHVSWTKSGIDAFMQTFPAEALASLIAADVRRSVPHD